MLLFGRAGGDDEMSAETRLRLSFLPAEAEEEEVQEREREQGQGRGRERGRELDRHTARGQLHVILRCQEVVFTQIGLGEGRVHPTSNQPPPPSSPLPPSLSSSTCAQRF